MKSRSVHVWRLTLAQLLALATVGDAGAQRQPRSVRSAVPHPNACYALSYAPDTLRYYMPAVVQFIEHVGSEPSHVARWRGGDVQRQNLHESFKLMSGTAQWRREGDSLYIDIPVLATFTIALVRRDTARARIASEPGSARSFWHGRAAASLGEGLSELEGDAFAKTTSCDAFRPPR